MENEKDKTKEPKTITVSVNENPVSFTVKEVTGLQIKETAINQGVQIKLDFNLFEKTGQKLHPIKDTEVVHLHEKQEFRAVTPDDNSRLV